MRLPLRVIIPFSLLWTSSNAFLIPSPALERAKSTLTEPKFVVNDSSKNDWSFRRPSSVLNAEVVPSSSSSSSKTQKAQQIKPPQFTSEQLRRRRTLLSRRGPHFNMDRASGDVIFGSTAKLVTTLHPMSKPNPQSINEWLSDGRGLALSIWDPKLLQDLGKSVYRLQTMKLQFVTITLSPSVDVQMWTEHEKPIQSGSSSSSSSSTTVPVFYLQSVSFDPNIQILPGIGVSAESLGIQIDVAGELRPSPDGTSVVGVIAFETRGKLAPPMRLLPRKALELASNTINEKVVSLAVESFQEGAVAQYRKFQQQKQLEQAQEQ